LAIDGELLALAREVQACDVRLALLGPFDADDRHESLRAELENRRADAARQLALLEAAKGWHDGPET
jgi:hypothetical protein